MTEPILSVRALARRRQTGDAVFHLRVPAFDLWPGDRVALTGASGCGKSTLLDLLALVLGPDEARRFALAPPEDGPPVDLLGLWRRRDLDALAERRGRHMGYVLQTGGLLGFLTVRDNIALPRRRLGLPDDGTIEALAERLGLIRHLARRPGQLSVGERQRVAIARALAHRPPIVLADEPTAALDPVTADATMALLLTLAEDLGVALVMASHDHDRIARFGLRPIAVHLATAPDGVTAVFEG